MVGTEAPVAGRSVEEAARGARRRSVWEHCGGDDGRQCSACRTLKEEEARLLHLEVSSRSPRCSDFEGWSSVSCLCVRRVVPTVPALAPTKALRSDASVPMRRRSSRAPRVAGSAATMGEPPRRAVVATGPQQEATAAQRLRQQQLSR
jgi:hypothetical protein